MNYYFLLDDGSVCTVISYETIFDIYIKDQYVGSADVNQLNSFLYSRRAISIDNMYFKHFFLLTNRAR